MVRWLVFDGLVSNPSILIQEGGTKFSRVVAPDSYLWKPRSEVRAGMRQSVCSDVGGLLTFYLSLLVITYSVEEILEAICHQWINTNWRSIGALWEMSDFLFTSFVYLQVAEDLQEQVISTGGGRSKEVVESLYQLYQNIRLLLHQQIYLLPK